MDIREFIDFIKEKGFLIDNYGTTNPYIELNGNKIRFDLTAKKYSVDGINHQHSRTFDLSKLDCENFSVVMFLLKLFKKGYSYSVITLEKTWQLGHEDKGYLDIMIKNPSNNDIYMVEVKTSETIKKYVDNKHEKDTKQVLSYAMQERSTKILSFYAYDFENSKDEFFNIYTENILQDSQNVDDFYERWNKQFDNEDYIEINDIFNIKPTIKKYSALEEITGNITQLLFNQFATILRQYSISDKPSAFMKMINLLLAKISDESTGDKKFKVKDSSGNVHELEGLKFQYINGIDTPESFMKRLNELYKKGMLDYLQRQVIDYDDDEIENILARKVDDELLKVLDNLRLKKSNSFSFIEVFDDETFLQNQFVVRDVVEMLQKYKFKYGTRHEFLGDFFEKLLNTSLKQEAGQFFTPYPLVDFMIDSLPFEEHMLSKLKDGQSDIVPSVIDYACGAGHFLISSMSKTQKIIEKLANDESNFATDDQKRKVKAYVVDPYLWVSKDNVVGIEKDYRLAKTTKIAGFLNGDGAAEIIAGDGINKFDSKDYANTTLASNKKKIEKFDYLISNPPYSVDGFMRNLVKNNISPTSNDFSLLKAINYSDSAIEKLFVERAWQLVKKDGYVAIVLPQSILAGDKYKDLREFIFNNFRIISMLLTADITFSGTTTSPVILIMKKEHVSNIEYETCIIGSPKYLNPTGNKMKNAEVGFLGYEFSSNRSKEGTKYKPTSYLKEFSPYMHKYVVSGKMECPDKYKQNIRLVKLSDVIVNKENDYIGDIYPKYHSTDGKSLSEICSINSWKETDFTNVPTDYLEIGDISGDDMESGGKNKTTKRYCKTGDILVCSLNPVKEKITVADKPYMCSTAIYVLSNFENDEIKNKVLKELREKYALEQMNSMCEGFKITYSKISETNLYKNVKLKLD